MGSFADYFVLCGLDSNSGLEPLNPLNGEQTHCTPLDRSYKPKVLGHYPNSVLGNPFDQDAVCTMCLPNGLQLRTQKHNLEPRFHSFLITRSDGSRVHGFSLIVFERVSSSSRVPSAIQTLQAMHLAELSSSPGGHHGSHHGGHHQASGPPSVARRRLQAAAAAAHLHENGSMHGNTRSLPRHFKLWANQKAAAQSYYDATKDTLYVSKSLALLCRVPFVRAAKRFLRGLLKYATAGKKVTSPPLLSIESYVRHILFECPLPASGQALSMWTWPPEERETEREVLQSPSSRELPHFDYPLRELFGLLGVELTLQLFTCVLLENQVLLYSADLERLMLVAESISALLYPFSWQHVYVPILPASLLHFLDAPVPFIMGLQGSSDLPPSSPSSPSPSPPSSLPSEASLCLLDVDRRRLQLPEEDLPPFPHHRALSLELSGVIRAYHMPLPSDCPPSSPSPASNPHYYQPPTPQRKFSWTNAWDSAWDSPEAMSVSLDGPRGGATVVPPIRNSPALRRITAIARKQGVRLEEYERLMDKDSRRSEGSSDSPRGDDDEEEEDPLLRDLCFNNAIREIFLNRFVHMFASYEHFVIQPEQDARWEQDSMQNFDKATFLSDQPEQHLPFLSRFIETQMFASLVDAKRSGREPRITLLDRRIRVFQERCGEAPSSTYEPCVFVKDSNALLKKRMATARVAPPPQGPLEVLADYVLPAHPHTTFPLLDQRAFQVDIPTAKSRRKSGERSQGHHHHHHHHHHRHGGHHHHRHGGHHHHHHQHHNHQSQHHPRHQRDSEDGGEEEAEEEEEEESAMAAARGVEQGGNRPGVSPSEPRYALIARANWSFVEQLVKECKTRTKRMLVHKMGREAVELGHGDDSSLRGLEENTLVAGLCDLLERMWAHGLVTKRGRSALWSHLLHHQDLTAQDLPLRSTSGAVVSGSSASGGRSGGETPLDPYLLSPDLSSSKALDMESGGRSPERKQPAGGGGICSCPLKPLPTSLAYDMRSVQAMTEIKTHIGYARAFVRLSLEKKRLSAHLRTLLSDTSLLRSLYKRYAFLRTDDERDQVLLHLLSLNAVDFYCFTNAYLNTLIPYRVAILTPRKSGGSSASSSPGLWISISGTLGDSGTVHVLPRGSFELVFQHKNLGVLITSRIGLEDSPSGGGDTGAGSKILVDAVLVRNEVTGHTVRFGCGRWLGVGVDDGSRERLLVGETIPLPDQGQDSPEDSRPEPAHVEDHCEEASQHNRSHRHRGRSPSQNRSHAQAHPHPRSPSLPRVGPPVPLDASAIPEAQRMLGDAVNAIVKHLYSVNGEGGGGGGKGQMALLLCGEGGLVACLEMVFAIGFKSSRIFSRNLYLWDYFDKLREYFQSCLTHEEERGRTLGVDRSDLEHVRVMRAYVRLVSAVNLHSRSLGKDGKFQLFICLAAREHLLHRMLLHIATTPVTAQMFEEQSFLRDPNLVTFLVQILRSLADFDMTLDHSLTKGID